MCGVAIADEHGHVADTQDHRLLCVCRPCYLLFSADGAGGRPLPRRRHRPSAWSTTWC